MTKTFKKFTSLLVALVFILSLVPFSALAEDDQAAPASLVLPFYNHVSTYKTTSGVQKYHKFLPASAVSTTNDRYRSFFQVDFSGYEYLLRDAGTKINLSLQPGNSDSTSHYLYDCDFYILSDENDKYADHYVPYATSDGTTIGMKYADVYKYITSRVEKTTGNTPFARRLDTTKKNKNSAAVITSDANMQVLISALDAATDNSVVTIQFADGPSTAGSNSYIRVHDNTHLKLTPTTNTAATPAKYVSDTKSEITWNMISSEERDSVVSNLNLINKYKGINITWSSTFSDVINPQTGVVTRKSQENDVTLTATLTYIDYTGKTTTDYVSFDVTVPGNAEDAEPVFGDTVNEGDTVLSNRSGDNYKPESKRMESVTDGLGGKGETDAYLLYGDVGGYRTVSIDNATGNQDVFEFSAYVPENAGGLQMWLTVRKSSGYGSIYFRILSDGIYEKVGNKLTKVESLKPNRWYNFAFITPEPGSASSAENDTDVHIYVNGVKAESKGIADFDYATTGFRMTPFLTALDTVTVSGGAQNEPAVYLDNIRIHSNPYAPEYDVLDEISYTDGIEGDSIIVKGKKTVSEFKAGITRKSDTKIRVYRQGAILSDTDYIEHGDVVVAAAKNGSEMERSYNYYTVNKIKYDLETVTKVNSDASDVYDSDDVIFASSKVSNYTEDSTYKVKMYAAQYEFGELIGLWESDGYVSISPGENETLTCDFAGIELTANSSIKIIVVDDKLTPIGKAATMRYKGGKEKASLFLLGDSTVQNYEDKTLDPIQGWGFHIGSFLNENITVKNRAHGGWTTDHYLYPDNIYTREDGVNSAGETLNLGGPVGDARRYSVWENVKKEIKQGDYLILNLGINDSGVSNGGNKVSRERFRENIETIYLDATKLGATVIFATPVPSGGDWDTTSFTFPSGRQNYGKDLTNTAAKYGFVCLPFGATVYGIYNDMVEEYLSNNEGATNVEAYNYVRNYFHLFKSKGTPPEGYEYSGEGNDSTHHNTVAAKHLAKIIAELLVESKSPLSEYVVIPQ